MKLNFAQGVANGAEMRLPISVIILTFNEEKNIEACLKSVYAFVDEIFIIDSFSTDKTLEIGRKFPVKIYQHAFQDYSRQRNWAQDNLPIKNEWVFHLDADERVTLELWEELKEIFSQMQIDADGLLVSRRTLFMGKWIRHGAHYPRYHLRLFKKGLGRCEDRLYDQHFYLTGGSPKVLKSDIIDTITYNLDNWIARHNKWATLEAQEVIRCRDSQPVCQNYRIKGSTTGNPIERQRYMREFYYRCPLFLRAAAYFLYRYILRLGFLDGIKGLIFHFLQGFWYRFLVDAKIYEYNKGLRL